MLREHGVELVGAPWLDGQRMAAYLNSRQIAGVRFVPVRFTPASATYKDQECGGVNIVVTDRTRLQSVALGIEIAAALRQLYPSDWKIDGFLRLLANSDAFERLKRGDSADSIIRSWGNSLEQFRAARANALLYD